MSVFDQAKRLYDLRSVMKVEGQVRKGRYDVGLCPFHNDHNPSLMIFRDGWRCLSPSCPRPRGSVLDWIALDRGQDNPTPVEIRAIAEDIVKDNVPRTPLRNRREKAYPEPLVLPGYTRTNRKYVSRHTTIHMKSIEYYHANLTMEAVDYLVGRGFSLKTIADQMWGWNGTSIVIPVWNEEGSFSKCARTLRFRNLRGNPRYYGVRDINQPLLYNSYCVVSAQENDCNLYVFYGEFDAALASQFGICAVSPTNGCKAFDPEWIDSFEGTIVFVPDVGEEDIAYRDANRVGIRAEVHEWTSFQKRHGKDFSEIYLSLNNSSHRAYDNLLRLFDMPNVTNFTSYLHLGR